VRYPAGLALHFSSSFHPCALRLSVLRTRRRGFQKKIMISKLWQIFPKFQQYFSNSHFENENILFFPIFLVAKWPKFDKNKIKNLLGGREKRSDGNYPCEFRLSKSAMADLEVARKDPKSVGNLFLLFLPSQSPQYYKLHRCPC
jgi:hypothetical protein